MWTSLLLIRKHVYTSAVGDIVDVHLTSSAWRWALVIYFANQTEVMSCVEACTSEKTSLQPPPSFNTSTCCTYDISLITSTEFGGLLWALMIQRATFTEKTTGLLKTASVLATYTSVTPFKLVILVSTRVYWSHMRSALTSYEVKIVTKFTYRSIWSKAKSCFSNKK